MKVIFLDFDGVLLSLRTCLAYGPGNRQAVDPVLCQLLKRVCGTGVQLVVSSTWRSNEQGARDKLREAGLLEYLYEEDWCTVHINTPESRDSRPQEIEEWMHWHPEADYRILDDDSFNWTPHQQARWLKCHCYDGAGALVMKDLLEWAGLLARQ